MQSKTHNRHMNATARWDAVVTRDRESDGAFVYAVRSTGVYCRPTCPSRRPRRDRVEFFDRADEARAAGFRACRRCHPDDSAVADPWVDKIRRACVYLSNVEGHPSLATLAERLGGSPYHLQRNFKRLVGVSPREYAEACRLRKVRHGLRHADDVTTAMLEAGYGSSGRFYERAVPKLGMSPSVYRRGGVGATIGYTHCRVAARTAARGGHRARRVRRHDGIDRTPRSRPRSRASFRPRR